MEQVSRPPTPWSRRVIAAVQAEDELPGKVGTVCVSPVSPHQPRLSSSLNLSIHLGSLLALQSRISRRRRKEKEGSEHIFGLNFKLRSKKVKQPYLIESGLEMRVKTSLISSSES